MTNKDIANFIKEHNLEDLLIVCDSAEPKSIEEIRRAKHGVLIKGATKGRDSINYGIDVMQRQDYLVTKNSINLIKELRSYCWDTDKQGKRLNKPIDKYNHALDAVRYHEMETLGLNQNYGSYSVM